MSKVPLIRPSTLYKKCNSILEIKEQIYIPSVQRNIIRQHVVEIKEYINKSLSEGKEPILGAIDLAYYDYKYYLIDGQHRFVALSEVTMERNLPIPFHCLIYLVTSQEELEEVFLIRNKNVPLADFLKSLNEEKSSLLKVIVSFLETNYKEIFRYDKKVRPYIEINTFIEHFRSSRLYSIIENISQFVDVFNMLNQECYTKVMTMTEKERKKYGVSDSMISVWSNNGVYIGFDKNYEFFSEKFDVTPFKKMLDIKYMID